MATSVAITEATLNDTSILSEKVDVPVTLGKPLLPLIGLPSLPLPSRTEEGETDAVPSSDPSTPLTPATPSSHAPKARAAQGKGSGVKGVWTQEEDEIVRKRVMKVSPSSPIVGCTCLLHCVQSQ